jgi:hypothetical protein
MMRDASLMTNHPPRTAKQNASLHLWLRQVSEVLNDAGLDIRATLKEDFNIPWTEYAAKELLWRPIQEILTGEQSSTKISTIEPSVIVDIIVRHIGEKHGVELPAWPDRFSHTGPREGQ